MTYKITVEFERDLGDDLACAKGTFPGLTEDADLLLSQFALELQHCYLTGELAGHWDFVSIELPDGTRSRSAHDPLAAPIGTAYRAGLAKADELDAKDAKHRAAHVVQNGDKVWVQIGDERLDVDTVEQGMRAVMLYNGREAARQDGIIGEAFRLAWIVGYDVLHGHQTSEEEAGRLVKQLREASEVFGYEGFNDDAPKVTPPFDPTTLLPQVDAAVSALNDLVLAAKDKPLPAWMAKAIEETDYSVNGIQDHLRDGDTGLPSWVWPAPEGKGFVDAWNGWYETREQALEDSVAGVGRPWVLAHGEGIITADEQERREQVAS